MLANSSERLIKLYTSSKTSQRDIVDIFHCPSFELVGPGRRPDEKGEAGVDKEEGEEGRG